MKRKTSNRLSHDTALKQRGCHLGSGPINQLAADFVRDLRAPKNGGIMSNLFWLSEEQMARLRPYFPKSHGKPRVDDRRVLSRIVLFNRNGLRWCDAP